MPKHVTFWKRTILIAVMFVILFAGQTHPGLAESAVTILKFDGTEKTVTTTLKEPREIFKEAGVRVGQSDLIKEENGAQGTVLTLKRALPVVVVRGESEQKFFTNKDTVGAALRDLKIRYDKQLVYPTPETKITSGLEIHILNKGDKISSEEADLEIPVKYYDDESIPYGEHKVEDQGAVGRVKIIKKSVAGADNNAKEVEMKCWQTRNIPSSAAALACPLKRRKDAKNIPASLPWKPVLTPFTAAAARGLLPSGWCPCAALLLLTRT